MKKTLTAATIAVATALTLTTPAGAETGSSLDPVKNSFDHFPEDAALISSDNGCKMPTGKDSNLSTENLADFPLWGWIVDLADRCQDTRAAHQRVRVVTAVVATVAAVVAVIGGVLYLKVWPMIQPLLPPCKNKTSQ